MNYLITITSFCVILALVGCNKTDDCGSAKVEFVFINNSDYQLSINYMGISLDPDELESIENVVEGVCHKLKECEIFPLFQQAVVSFNNGERCWVLNAGTTAGNGDGPAGTCNYEFERLNNRSYKMKFYFVNDHYDQAGSCE